jgi:hypothetical protein
MSQTHRSNQSPFSSRAVGILGGLGTTLLDRVHIVIIPLKERRGPKTQLLTYHLKEKSGKVTRTVTFTKEKSEPVFLKHQARLV